MVDAALAGLDRGEIVTIPSLPDVGQWEAYEAARHTMIPDLSLSSRPHAIASRPVTAGDEAQPADEERQMKSQRMAAVVIVVVGVVGLAVWGGRAVIAQDTGPAKYAVRVPNGLAFSEFRGYESWQVVAVSQTEGLLNVILANPVMIKAYQAGIPGNGKPFPDGSQAVKIHWSPKKLETLPTSMVPASLHAVAFQVKDSKRFAESGGWGWAAFKHNAASGTFTPATTADTPPQANDAKCGLACHTIVKARDYVFTDYGKR